MLYNIYHRTLSPQRSNQAAQVCTGSTCARRPVLTDAVARVWPEAILKGCDGSTT